MHPTSSNIGTASRLGLVRLSSKLMAAHLQRRQERALKSYSMIHIILGRLNPTRSHSLFRFATFIPSGRVVLAASIAVLAPSSPAQVQLQIGQNFSGSRFGVDSQLTPPDANGAIGPAH